MSPRNQGVAIFAAVIIMGGAASWWSSDSLRDISPAKDAQRHEVPGGAPPPHAMPSTSSSPDDARQSPALVRRNSVQPMTDIARLYETAPDQRALFDQLDRSASTEAPYFAAKILRRCIEVSKVGLKELLASFPSRYPSTASPVAVREEAYRKIHVPCKGFEGRPATIEEITEHVKEGARRGDPRSLAQAIAQRRPDDKSDPMSSAAKLIDTGDPYVLSELRGFLVQAAVGNGNVGGLPLTESDRAAAFLAWSMIACDHGLDCGPDSNQLLTSCAFDGRCGLGSVEDLMRNAWSADTQYRTALELRPRILEALRAKDYASFGIRR